MTLFLIPIVLQEQITYLGQSNRITLLNASSEVSPSLLNCGRCAQHYHSIVASFAEFQFTSSPLVKKGPFSDPYS